MSGYPGGGSVRGVHNEAVQFGSDCAFAGKIHVEISHNGFGINGQRLLVVPSELAIACLARIKFGVQIFVGSQVIQHLGKCDPTGRCSVHVCVLLATGAAWNVLWHQEVWHP